VVFNVSNNEWILLLKLYNIEGNRFFRKKQRFTIPQIIAEIYNEKSGQYIRKFLKKMIDNNVLINEDFKEYSVDRKQMIKLITKTNAFKFILNSKEITIIY